jgi:hypothetical protein
LSTDRGEAQAEVERLRARVAALEEQLIEVEAWANEAVARAQERTYWLDRWHVDLNQVMRRRSAERIRAVARTVRAVYRAAVELKSEYRR